VGSPIVRALLAELASDETALDELAECLAPRLRKLRLVDSAPDENRLMSTEEAAGYLSCSKRRLYDLVMLNKLEPRRDGRRLLFRRSDLDRYAEGGEIPARPYLRRVA
jgi:excisionase family DNA binding protein